MGATVMAEIPASWGLKTRKRKDGKVDIVGKDDSGQEYRVRTTDTSGVTEKDIQELKDADREGYGNPETRTKEFMGKLMAPGRAKKAHEEETLNDDLIEAAGPAVYAGMGKSYSAMSLPRKIDIRPLSQRNLGDEN